MKKVMDELLNRALANWKSSAMGLGEAALIPAAGAMANDDKTLAFAVALGLWRLLAGLLSRDPGK